jgi:hypothetical protein
MTEKNAYMTVMQGRTTDRSKSKAGKEFTLVFQDEEAELIFGEHRMFQVHDRDGVKTDVLGLQTRRGYAIIRGEAAGSEYDQLIMPRNLWQGVFSLADRKARAGVTWRIKPGEAQFFNKPEGDTDMVMRTKIADIFWKCVAM